MLFVVVSILGINFMVIALLFKMVGDFISLIFSWLPTVGVKDIPFIGSQVSYWFSLAVSYMNTAIAVFPFFAIVWHSFIYVILPFEFALLVAKFFFGHRLPAHLN